MLSGFLNSQQIYTVKIKSLFAAISVHVSIEFVIKSLFLILTVDMTLGDKHTHTKLLYYSGSFQIQVLLSIFFMAVDYWTSPSLYNPKVKQTTVCISCTWTELLSVTGSLIRSQMYWKPPSSDRCSWVAKRSYIIDMHLKHWKLDICPL